MGSLTMFGAIELQLLLRTFNFLGVGLVVLWILSPLGGQASLRLLDIGPQRAVTNQSVKYLDSDSGSILMGADLFEELGFLTDALYLSALLTSPTGQAVRMDTWGNVKIPIVEQLEQTAKSDADGWFTVPSNNISYSSLVGLPIAGIPITGSSNFSVESHYMLTSSCTTSSGSITSNVGASISSQGGFAVNFTGGTEGTPQILPYQRPYPRVLPNNVSFGAGSSVADLAFIAQCILTRSSVQSNITCHGASCGVAHIRRSKFDQRPPGYTPLSSSAASSTLSIRWPSAGNCIHHPGYSTPTEYFISDPTLRGLTSDDGGVNLIGMPADVFSQRFSLVLNTYWQSSLVPWYQTGNFPSNESLLGDSLHLGDGYFNSTGVTITTVTDVYVCNKTWAAILLVASSVLLLFGVYGAIVKYKVRGPQVLGFVSTMTRDNPYINLPPGGCTLDGLERTRLLKDREIKLRDIAPGREVGHIALSDAKLFETERLAFSRLYAG